MRKIVIITIILTLIFGMAGCNVHSEPGKKAVESSSVNAIVDITQAEETTQPTTTKTDTEKLSKEPIFSQTTTANTEPKQDTHTQTEPPKSEKSEPEITTNTVSEVTTAVEQGEKFDISYWISYAQNYAKSIGLIIDETATECWDNPISANANNKNIGDDKSIRIIFISRIFSLSKSICIQFLLFLQ